MQIFPGKKNSRKTGRDYTKANKSREIIKKILKVTNESYIGNNSKKNRHCLNII